MPMATAAATGLAAGMCGRCRNSFRDFACGKMPPPSEREAFRFSADFLWNCLRRFSRDGRTTSESAQTDEAPLPEGGGERRSLLPGGVGLCTNQKSLPCVRGGPPRWRLWGWQQGCAADVETPSVILPAAKCRLPLRGRLYGFLQTFCGIVCTNSPGMAELLRSLRKPTKPPSPRGGGERRSLLPGGVGLCTNQKSLPLENLLVCAGRPCG